MTKASQSARLKRSIKDFEGVMETIDANSVTWHEDHQHMRDTSLPSVTAWKSNIDKNKASLHNTATEVERSVKTYRFERIDHRDFTEGIEIERELKRHTRILRREITLTKRSLFWAGIRKRVLDTVRPVGRLAVTIKRLFE